MNKAELIEVVASRIDASKKDAAEAVQAVVDAIQEAVATGQKVSISGFGVFEKASRPARTYRKPSTGEAIRKVATSVPKFRPGGDFKAFVSGEKNIADAAVKAARDAGEGVSAAAGTVVEQALAAVGRPARKADSAEPQEAPAAAKAPAKRAPAKRAPAKRAAKVAAPVDAAPAAEPVAEAPAAQAAAPEAPAKKTAAKRAPAKRTTKKVATDAAPAKRAPAKRTTKKAAVAAEAPAAE